MKKPQEEMFITLDGKILLRLCRGKKEIWSEELDGETCLNAILYVIEEGMKLFKGDLTSGETHGRRSKSPKSPRKRSAFKR